MLGVMCEAFHLPYPQARELFYRDPYFSLENKRVLVRDGRVLSCLTLADVTMWIGRAQVRVVGIANVCTAQAERRRGYGRRLLTDTVLDLSERGYGFAGLLPYSYGFYRRLGWDLCSNQYRFTSLPSLLPPYREARFVRPAQPEDVRAMAHLYHRYSRGRTGWCTRDAKRWDYLMGYVKGRVVYRYGGSFGYMLYDVAHRNGHRASLKVLEMVADHSDAYCGFIGFLAGHSGDIESVEYPTAWDHLGRTGLAAIVTDADAPHRAGIEVTPGMMLRVVNLVRVLEALSPNFSDWRGEVVLSQSDPITSEQIVVVRSNGTEVEVENTGRPVAGAPLITGTAQAWAQVLSGYLSLAEALSLHRLAVAAGEVGEDLLRVFPRRDPFLPLPDHF